MIAVIVVLKQSTEPINDESSPALLGQKTSNTDFVESISMLIAGSFSFALAAIKTARKKNSSFVFLKHFWKVFLLSKHDA